MNAAFSIPILPPTSPQAPQPKGLVLPLYAHQLRALHRCLVIENDGGALSENFHERYDYKSKGGVLADAVGTGKTATSIGLILSSNNIGEGDTLVVAPSHLILQWRDEIRKFAAPNAIQVLVGKQEYEAKASLPPPPGTKRVVLVDVDTILQEQKVWYDFRKIYESKGGGRLTVSQDTLEKYKKAAQASVKSPRGPCSYEGWVYTGSLHHPFRPWRRVIFDEIQDCVAAGTVSQKNLLQLSRTAPHVWLLSATPFPHGNESIYANHELLGFCRLRLNVQQDATLPRSHPFEIIKRKLYIRSPRHVAETAVVATQKMVKNTLQVPQMQVETTFYQMELQRIREENGNNNINNYFDDTYASLREMTVHPEASQELREQAMGNNNYGNAPTDRVGQFSSVGSFAKVSHSRAKIRQTELVRLIHTAKEQLHATKQSLLLAQQVQQVRDIPVTANPFAGPTTSDASLKQELEASKIHNFYCNSGNSCKTIGGHACRGNRQVYFRTIPNEDGTSGAEWIRGGSLALKSVILFFQDVCSPTRTVAYGQGNVPALEHYISTTSSTVNSKTKTLKELEQELNVVRTRVQMLGGTISANTVVREHDLLASTHGSKPAALVRFLREIQAKGEQAIVFSYWHDTLRLVQRTLKRCSLSSAFCDGRQMAQALVDFTSQKVSFLLLSAQAKASGTNLQCATNVILLDPAGSSAEHGAALEQQAIGRAVRMGQDRHVTVTRFCVTGTMEAILFQEIDIAALTSRQNSNDATYVIEGADTKLPAAAAKSESTGDDNANDVEVTESLTASERIQREFVQAKEEGLVVDLVDTDDDDERTEPITGTRVVAKSSSSEGGLVPVKVEPANTSIGKRQASEMNNGCSQGVSPPKRIRENPNDNMADTPSAEATEASPADAVTPETAANVSPPASQESSTDSAMENDSVAGATPISRSSSSLSTMSEESNEKTSTGMAAVKALLERCELSTYAERFKDQGYDCIDWLLDIASDAAVMEKLASDVGFKPGHAIRFQHLLSKEARARKPIIPVSAVVDV